MVKYLDQHHRLRIKGAQSHEAIQAGVDIGLGRTADHHICRTLEQLLRAGPDHVDFVGDRRPVGNDVARVRPIRQLGPSP